MGYGTMYQGMKGPASGAQKATGFAGTVQTGRAVKKARKEKQAAKAETARSAAQAGAVQQANANKFQKPQRGLQGGMPEK